MRKLINKILSIGRETQVTKKRSSFKNFIEDLVVFTDFTNLNQ